MLREKVQQLYKDDMENIIQNPLEDMYVALRVFRNFKPQFRNVGHED